MAGVVAITHRITVAGTVAAITVAGTAVAIMAAAVVTTTITEEVILMANAGRQVPMFTVAMQAADHHLQQQYRQETTDAEQVP
jgi:hypothetical protein